MGLCDAWVSVRDSLAPNKPYRVSYSAICLNGTSSNDLASALSAVGIVMTPDVSVLTGSSGAWPFKVTQEFGVTRPMSVSEFTGKLEAAFAEASKTAFVQCSRPEIGSIEQQITAQTGVFCGSGSPIGDTFKGIGAGVILSAILIGFGVWWYSKGKA